MPRTIQADGRLIQVPDDATPDEINQIVGPAPAPTPLPTMSAAPPRTSQQIVNDFAADLRTGGARTSLGRLLGQMQGRGDQGYTGLNSGGNKGTAEILGSPELGVTQMAQGGEQLREHPLNGAMGILGGALKATTIPGMVMGGPGAAAAAEAIPSASHAAGVFNELNAALANHPVVLSKALDPLQRATEIAERGGTAPTAISKLLQRSQAIEPMSFPEARDYQSSLSDLSMSDKLAMNGRMAGQVKRVGSGLFDDIHAAASDAGMGDQYKGAMQEYRQAMMVRNALKTAAKYGIGVGAGAAGVNALAPHLKSLIGQ